MGDQAAELFRRRSEQYKLRSEKLRTIMEWVEEDPSFAVELATLLSSPEANGLVYPPRLGKQIPDNPILEPVVQVFKDRPGEWLSTAEVCRASGIERSKVRWLIEGGKHRTQFEQKVVFPNKTVWRLKPDADPSTEVAELPPPKPKRKPPAKRKARDGLKVGTKQFVRPKWGPPGLVLERIEDGGDTRSVQSGS